MRIYRTVHHSPSNRVLPVWLLLFLLRLPRWLVPICWDIWGKLPGGPFGDDFNWPKETPDERPLYIRCPLCLTEWLWKGERFECGACKFLASNMITNRAQILRRRVYLGTFTAWRNEKGEGAWQIRAFNGYPPDIQQAIIDMVFMPMLNTAIGKLAEKRC